MEIMDPLKGFKIKFPEGNNISYYQDFTTKQGLPSDVEFKIRERHGDNIWLVAYGYGLMETHKSYGNGSICVKDEIVFDIILKENSGWINTKHNLPREGETVWALCADGTVFLGCYTYIENEGFFWGISNGVIYSEGLKIITECELEDEYDVVCWHRLPELPKI